MRTEISTSAGRAPVILCISHLGWDYVWQRPQHILSRLAEHYEVVYVHEPRIDSTPEDAPRLELIFSDDRVTAWQPVFPDRPDVLGCWREEYRRTVEDLLVRQGLARWSGGRLVSTRPIILWFYTPTPWYLLDAVPAELVVYDVMDDLASFKGASQDLREREARLLSRADLVFAGGRSICEARRQKYPGVRLFPSGVDAGHFAAALDPALPIAQEIAQLPHPVLGYYGVIDERIDRELLSRLAVEHPEWSLALVGPVTKVEREALPAAPNLHYIPAQPYERLPAFLKGFDVATMPFALNEATRYISPTKTLEYMAAHKPVVSTPVPDVVNSWGKVVRIAYGPTGFAQAVTEALSETDAQREGRIAMEREAVAQNSWDGIASRMLALLRSALDRRRAA